MCEVGLGNFKYVWFLIIRYAFFRTVSAHYVLHLSQGAVWNIGKQMMLYLDIQSKTDEPHQWVLCFVIHCARNLVRQEVQRLCIGAFGLDVRQLGNKQKQEPCEKIKHKGVLKSEAIENCHKY